MVVDETGYRGRTGHGQYVPRGLTQYLLLPEGRSPMDFGVVLQTNPPASRTVELARQAETHGFSHVWTFDSHLLWQEPFVIYSAILAATRKVMVGPMVTNPATRDWTVIASPVRDAQRDVRQPDHLRDRPRRLGRPDAARPAVEPRDAARRRST